MNSVQAVPISPQEHILHGTHHGHLPLACPLVMADGDTQVLAKSMRDLGNFVRQATGPPGSVWFGIHGLLCLVKTYEPVENTILCHGSIAPNAMRCCAHPGRASWGYVSDVTSQLSGTAKHCKQVQLTARAKPHRGRTSLHKEMSHLHSESPRGHAPLSPAWNGWPGWPGPFMQPGMNWPRLHRGSVSPVPDHGRRQTPSPKHPRALAWHAIKAGSRAKAVEVYPANTHRLRKTLLLQDPFVTAVDCLYSSAHLSSRPKKNGCTAGPESRALGEARRLSS